MKHGVYVIETKTYSKPETGKPEILFKGDSLLINSKHSTDQPIIQVKTASTGLKRLSRSLQAKSLILDRLWFSQVGL